MSQLINWPNFKKLPRCEFGTLSSMNGPNDEPLCGEPASYKVWWKEDAADSMFVCDKHAREIEIADEPGL